ncbi:MAG: hypothetical protein Q9182_000457 [Xanthomendoza sp. 2 TL-2023]
MAPSPKPDHHLNLNYLPQLSASQPRSGSSTANTSPIEAPSGSAVRSPFGNPGSANGLGSAGNMRLGAGSPSHELGGRLYSKRAREIQAQEGLTPSMWGPPASGGSTPLRETIPESPSQDGFPDFMPPAESSTQTTPRRSRAGTVPSRFSPASSGPGGNNGASLLPKTSRPTPSTSPFRSPSLTARDASSGNSTPGRSTSALLSRLRAGSMPQQKHYVESANLFGNPLFSTGWGNGRDRSSTLTSIRSADAPDSPAHSAISRDSLADTDVKTLDYLGLAETPRQSQATIVPPGMQRLPIQPFISELAGFRNANRFRSYSVNAKEKYAEDEDDDIYQNAQYSGQQSGAITPLDATTAAALAATQAQIHQHNLAVQAFANQATGTRPRARTAGVLESPLRSFGRNSYLATPSRLDRSVTAADFGLGNGLEYADLPEAVRALQLNHAGIRSNAEAADDNNNLDGPTRALWLGNIPASTTVTSLQAIFQVYGNIESTRVLVHKNCGFVNFENIDSAIAAKTHKNGTEIFPGAGPVRIGYAKAPSASVADAPGSNGNLQSRSPDPFSNGQSDLREAQGLDAAHNQDPHGAHAQTTAAALEVPELSALKEEILQIVGEFDATNQDQVQISNSIDGAIAFDRFEAEIAPVPEPSHARIHDAPKLREIRKRIDNNAISQAEIEEIAIDMLPEIAELASDYLGNTVVQKLFEFCSEAIKDKMLVQIDPHLAEIGVHKNGTWAAQKIIDVAIVPTQKRTIVDSLRPYTVALFLDQYGNYVLQCCLRFGHPWNNFIFETMLSRMWDIAQGRFGARAMRACLESHHATKDQQRMLAAAIALHSVQLATNANGALLLTWFLDTCNFPRRRVVLAPRLVPHLVHLCTHKVAYLTVLKVINQRSEPEARDIVLRALFFSENDQTLEDILSDQACGATLIFKVLTTPFLEDKLRADIVQNVRNVLNRLNITSPQAYKRLMDEVGLSNRGGKPDRDNHSRERGRSQNNSRSGSQQRPSTGRKHAPETERQFNGQYYQPQQFPVQGVFGGTSGGMDPNGMAAYEHFTPGLAGNPQLQQTYLATQARGMSQPDFYPGLAASGLGGYNSPTIDPNTFRAMQAQQQYPRAMPPMSPSPMLQPPPFGAPQSYNPLMAANGMTGAYQYPMQYIPQQQQQQSMMQQQNGGRRGRR